MYGGLRIGLYEPVRVRQQVAQGLLSEWGVVVHRVGCMLWGQAARKK